MSKNNYYSIFIYIIFLGCSTTHEKVQVDHELEKRVTITGHRGAAGISPENTIESISKALQFNVDRVEIDVRQTKDKVVVLMHDKQITRTTNGKGRVNNISYEKLMEYKIDKEFKVPTLKEALQAVNGKAVLLIEIKEGHRSYPGIEKSVLALIDEYDANEWCIVQSFEDDVLKKVHSLNPKVKLHKLLLTSIFYDLNELDFVDEFSIHYFFATKKFVDKVHSIGKKVNVWTVNDKDKMEELVKIGVDGIITDIPSIIN